MSTEKGEHDWLAFYRKFVDRAVYESGPNKQAVDLQMTKKMIEGSPKDAQVAIQMLWQHYKKLKAEGNPLQSDFRLHCCSMAFAYIGAYGPENWTTKKIMNMCPGLDEEVSAFVNEDGRLKYDESS